MIKTFIVILFSFVIIATLLPTQPFLSILTAVEVLNNDDEKESTPQDIDDLDGEEVEDVQEKQLFFNTQSSEILFKEPSAQVVVDYIESNSSYALKIQLPPPELQI